MELEDLMKRVHQYTNDVIVITEAEPICSPGPRIVFVNDAFEQQTGYSRDEVIGLSPRVLQGPETNKETMRQISQALLSWKPVREEILNYRKDGTEFWSELSILPVADATGWYRYWVSVQRDVTERRAMHMELEYAATRDALTGMLNRFGFSEWIKQQVQVAHCGFGVLHLDLDRFKILNDTFGHQAGDMVLKATGHRLNENMKPLDVGVRLGGDEFLIVRPGSDEAGLAHLADNLIPALSKPVEYDGHDCRFGVSIGGAYGSPLELQTGSLANNADIALYQSKNKGRNRYTFFSPHMVERQHRQKSLSEDLASAVAHGEFSISLMPQLNVATQNISGYEALVRWEHPSLGTLMPNEFLPLAEQLKLTGEIDRIVFHLAVDAQRTLASHRLPGAALSVNVSSRRLLDPNLMSDLRGLNIASSTLTFELLESILLDDLSTELGFTIDAIREMGISLEVDDFGTGHASIKSLTQLQPDRLKLDRSVVDPIVQSERHKRVLKSILDISDALEIPAVAEGVETTEQAQLLKQLGTAYLQGYLIGRPQSLIDIVSKRITSQPKTA